VGIEQAPNSLSVVTGIGSLLAIVGNPFFGRMSDRTSSRLGMRRPWMVIGLVGGSLGILVVALAPRPSGGDRRLGCRSLALGVVTPHRRDP
jgi:MFS family permease